jgi:hypothetical protein
VSSPNRRMTPSEGARAPCSAAPIVLVPLEDSEGSKNLLPMVCIPLPRAPGAHTESVLASPERVVLAREQLANSLQ